MANGDTMTKIDKVTPMTAKQLRRHETYTAIATLSAVAAVAAAVMSWPAQSAPEPMPTLDAHTLRVGLALAHIIPTQCQRNGGVRDMVPDTWVPNGFKFVCADGAQFPDTVRLDIR